MKKKKYDFIIYIIFFITVTLIFDGFTNTYIVMRENYEARMIKFAGLCNNQGYGFYKNVIENFSDSENNINVINYNDFPPPNGYFFKYKNNEINKNQIILIGASKKNLKKFTKDNFKIIYSERDCFYLKK